MPSYFYHLKFELYPRPYPATTREQSLSAGGRRGGYGAGAGAGAVASSSFAGGSLDYECSVRDREKEEGDREGEEREEREVYLPCESAGIFENKDWPAHRGVEIDRSPRRRRVEKEEEEEKGELDLNLDLDLGVKTTGRDSRSRNSRGGAGGGGGGAAVIDCGTTRVLPPVQSAPDGGDGAALLLPVSANQRLEFPTPDPRFIRRSLEGARRDWRFGRVRVESLDMEGLRPGHRRGESSTAVQRGFIAGGVDAGRVMKARFEGLGGGRGTGNMNGVEGKNTEIGWGVVHLFRDGDEGLGGVEVYNAHSGENVQGEMLGSAASAGDGEKGVVDVEDYTTLCIPAVPGYFTASDFLGWVGEKTREEVSHFRMVMTGRMNRYLVLMKFRDGGVARRWREEWDGKVFNTMEPETCHVMFIKSITFQPPTASTPSNNTSSFPELSHDPFTPSTQSTSLKPFPPPTPNLVELPTCPVCLERMDDTTGLLTILCQHVFHCDCLQKWRGSGCPVCRHTNPSLALPLLNSSSSSTLHDPSNLPFGSGEASLCSICDSTDDLWICLICGNVGCGRYKGGHAKEHWKESAHNFALEIETQHVWDYAGDMWVHRLIRDKGDGKVVELPSRRPGRDTTRGEEGMDMVPREKLEGIGMEYTHLLTSQLESQRVYFEDLVSKAVAKASAASASAASASTRADEALSRLSGLEHANRSLREEVIITLEKDLARERKKAEKSAEVARGFGKSLMEEKKVSEGLMERIGHVNSTMAKIAGEMSVLREENADLKEQNRDLLFSITAGEKLKGMDAEEGLVEGEVEGGTIEVPLEKEKGKRKGKGRK